MLRTRTWIVILLAFALAMALLSALLLTKRGEGSVVRIIQDGKVIEEIDLSKVLSEYSFTVEAPGGGYNIITVQPGRIRVSEADCPDQICVGQGWLSDRAAPIVCMPHKLMIMLKGEGETDAVSK